MLSCISDPLTWRALDTCADQVQQMTGPGDQKQGLVHSHPVLGGVGCTKSVFSTCVQDSYSDLRGLGLPGAHPSSLPRSRCALGRQGKPPTGQTWPQSPAEAPTGWAWPQSPVEAPTGWAWPQSPAEAPTGRAWPQSPAEAPASRAWPQSPAEAPAGWAWPQSPAEPPMAGLGLRAQRSPPLARLGLRAQRSPPFRSVAFGARSGRAIATLWRRAAALNWAALCLQALCLCPCPCLALPDASPF